MRETLRTSVLLLAFCASAPAGEIPNPSGPQTGGRTEVAGEIPNPPAPEPETDGDTQFGLTATWLSVIESMFALL